MPGAHAIATITLNPAIDKSSSVIRVAPEQKLRCAQPVYEPGGGGINVSRVIHELGGTAHTLHTSGGPTGRLLERLLADHGLLAEPIHIESLTRENLVVYEDSSGEQYRFNMPGPQVSEEEAQQLAAALEGLSQPYVVASGSLPPGVPPEFYARPARRLHRNGQRFIIDTSGPALQAAVEEHVFLIKPNMREMRDLVGHAVDDAAAAESAARELVGGGRCECVVVSLGSEGAIISSESGTMRIQSPDIVPVSKVGAGDSMVAAMVYQLAQGLPFDAAARYGVAAGAAACLTAGTGLCRREDVDRLFAEMSD